MRLFPVNTALKEKSSLKPHYEKGRQSKVWLSQVFQPSLFPFPWGPAASLDYVGSQYDLKMEEPKGTSSIYTY